MKKVEKSFKIKKSAVNYLPSISKKSLSEVEALIGNISKGTLRFLIGIII
jgi:hypothetical protein